MQGVLHSIVNKLIERNDALKAVMTTLKEETKAMLTNLNTKTKELKGELVVYRIVMVKGMLRVAPKHKRDFPKDVDNFLWGMEQYFMR